VTPARRDACLVALLAMLAPLAALAVFGVIQTNDSGSYVAYAEALRAGPLPAGEALLRSGPQPVTLFRTIGFPAVLAALQSLAPQGWPGWLVALQIAAQAGIAVASHHAARRLGFGRVAAVIAALLPAVGLTVYAQIALMTDALYATLATGAALSLLIGGLAGAGLRPVLLAGGLLGLGCLLREATPYLALGYLPAAAIAAGQGRRLLGMALLYGPVLLVASGMAAAMYQRAGIATLSTSRQIVMVQAVLPLLKRGVPVYDGDDLFDTTARETVGRLGYQGIDPLIARLFAAGMTSPDIAATASARYARTWRRHPIEMLRAMMVRFPAKMLAVAFQPLDVAAELVRQTGTERPDFVRLDGLWREIRDGSPGAALLLLGVVGGRIIGTVLTLVAMLAPALLQKGDPRRAPLWGAWATCGAFLGVHLPVHLEPRYLLPIIPLVCLLGMVGLEAIGRRWARRYAAPQPAGSSA